MEPGARPWDARADWARGVIDNRYGSSGPLVYILGLPIIVIGVLVTAFGLYPAYGPVMLCWTVPVVLVGIAITYGAGRGGWERRRYGTAQLRLHAVPVRLAGALDATLSVPGGLPDGTQVRLRLTGNSGAWEASATAPAVSDGASSVVAVHFEMPAEGTESSLDPRAEPTWHLDATASVPGRWDFTAQFELPVFGNALPG